MRNPKETLRNYKKGYEIKIKEIKMNLINFEKN